ncbi:MAG: Glucoamylase [uncultured Truepera sp.]|uniref:Glucoamylase n=1 Tax=uncultured Truepera sp. TaxID=543023 RepID=A0A6J4VI53_9DEIN|nr:MAG: Glucoamylase [uncultured Truepera sp.]
MDWLCLPHFDSPSVFGAILDDAKGGRFHIAPTNEGATTKQLYWPDTNILVTRFLSPEGVAELIDFMPVGGEQQLVRRVRCVRGEVTFRALCQPAFNYARDPHVAELTAEGAVFRTTHFSLALATLLPLQLEGAGVCTDFSLREGEMASFVLASTASSDAVLPCPNESEMERLFQATVAYWRHWLSKCTYQGRWREMVQRSALALKLLTFAPTGAIVAAATCGLPETLGGGRIWDHRYTWIRDAAFSLYGLLRIGFTEEAAAFMEWLSEHPLADSPDGSLNLMYRIGEQTPLHEEVLEHLEGYRGSSPVRIGNDASGQLQLDIYGELLDAVYLYNKHGAPISYDLWQKVRRLLNWLCDNWRRPDEGIWEPRGGPQQNVYSKVMCWVALDRGARLAEKRSFPSERERWLKERDEIYEEVMERGWSEARGAFVQSYGSDALDAATLMMPLVFFLSPTDPRMLRMLEAIQKSPVDGGLLSDGLVYHYNFEHAPDGLMGEEGTFNMCTFWLVEALTRAGRTDPKKLDEARLMFERMLGYANHLGLYAEETGPSGEALGNFPQAFTHLSLISAAFNLDRALGKRS